MPIRSDLKKFYQGAEWRAVRRSILERAGDRCEQCGKPNGRVVESRFLKVWRVPFARDGVLVPLMWWRGAGWPWHSCGGNRQVPPRYYDRETFGRVVLTVAHLNHVAGDDRPENLKALCQWCHLNYDRLHHHETRGTRKDGGRPLLTSPASVAVAD
jgi:hypothetical protein